MQKSFGLILAVLFLAVQALSALHMAGHGFAEHEHAGRTCDIYLHCEQGKAVDTPSPAVSAALVSDAPAPSFSAGRLSAQEYRHLHHPRAPPAILLS